jgi:hypothetical protein
MTEIPTPPAQGPAPLARPGTFPPGRLGTLVALGAASGAIPLPFVPTRLQQRIRGALVHDVASRHGLSLSTDARELLCEPDSPDPGRARLVRTAAYLTRSMLRRAGPVAMLGPAWSALDTFALGHLFDRYLERVRRSASVRLQAPEAREVRRLIDRAMLRFLSPELHVAREGRADGAPAEDARDEITRLSDALLLVAASAPAYLVRRLEAAFDAVVADTPEAGSAR